MSKEYENLLKMKSDLEGMINNFGGSKEMIDMTQDLLPKDKFNAEIDGINVEVSSGLSGRAIVFVFHNPKDQEKIYAELKENKKGFFKRIFNIK
jgi:hypothetical protein